jgi:hypothetical protein
MTEAISLAFIESAAKTELKACCCYGATIFQNDLSINSNKVLEYRYLDSVDDKVKEKLRII